MKKILFMLCLLLVVFAGCNSHTVVKEDFSDEYYKNFSDVKNIVYYLKLNKDKVTTLSENENQLIFCFTVNYNLDIHDESIISYANYVRNLESEGYQLNALDATISSTLKLDNNNYTISITIISSIDEFKRVHNEISNIDKITSENILYELTKNRQQ